VAYCVDHGIEKLLLSKLAVVSHNCNSTLETCMPKLL